MTILWHIGDFACFAFAVLFVRAGFRHNGWWPYGKRR